MDSNKKEIRPIYSRLSSFLKQGEKTNRSFMSIEKGGLVNLFHDTIEELNSVTDLNFDKFKMIDKSTGGTTSSGGYYSSFGSAVSIEEYNGKLSGIIGELYGLYFYNEINPLDGSPSTVINHTQSQTQNQNQSVHVEIIIQMRDLIDEKIKKADTPEKKSFLSEIKNGLRNVGDINKLIQLILKTGDEIGLSVNDIYKLLS